MLNSIPKTRLLLYIMVLGLIPIALACFYLMNQLNDVELLEQRIYQVRRLAAQIERKQAINKSVRENLKDSDRFYIDKQLESVSLLKHEVENLQRIVNNKNFAGDEDIKRRLEFLTSPSNRILFSESNVQSFAYVNEETVSLVHPVEVDVEDLKKILTRIEGVEFNSYKAGANKPQLIILDFKIDKKSILGNNEVYSLNNLKLLKREFS